jgi:RNA polymerase sigma-54 factor
MHARLALKAEYKITPQQILTSTLLQASAADLEELIRRELAENPALEERAACSTRQAEPVASIEEATFSTEALGRFNKPNKAPTLDELVDQLVAQPTAIEQLSAQAACLVDGAELALLLYLLHSLDQHGYLRTPIAKLAQAACVDETAVTRAVKLLHELEPPGIGARDLRECLQLQCAHLAAIGVECSLVWRILDEAWAEFSTQQWGRVARRLQVSRGCVEAAQRFIRSNFYPYPLALVNPGASLVPPLARADLVIQCKKSDQHNVYSIVIPNALEKRLRISTAFVEAVQNGASAEAHSTPLEQRWLNSHINRASHFLQALNGRWIMLRRIGEQLIDDQTAFLAQGPRYLRPLTQSIVAAAIGVHESTVSRAVQGKNVLLPSGRLMPLCDFFDHSLPAKAAMQQLLSCTDRRVSDREIADSLRAEGIDLARRTVAKYREKLKVVPGYMRN